MPHSLVLNASYEPLCVVPQRRAVILILNNKAVTLEESGLRLHAASVELPAPSVIKLTRYVRIPARRGVPLTRRAIFARDGGRCVYCDAPATSVDHVIPRSRGGQHAWENVVSSCRRCNHVKADRPLPDLGWRMKRQPVQPRGSAWRILSSGRTDPNWFPYLRGYGADLDLLPFEPLGPDGVLVPGPGGYTGPTVSAAVVVAAAAAAAARAAAAGLGTGSAGRRGPAAVPVPAGPAAAEALAA